MIITYLKIFKYLLSFASKDLKSIKLHFYPKYKQTLSKHKNETKDLTFNINCSLFRFMCNDEQCKALQDLQYMISSKGGSKMKMLSSIVLCLNYTQAHPEDASCVGVLWLSNDVFIINTRIFGSFSGRKPNSINRNFREHCFHQKKTTYAERKLILEKYSPSHSLPDTVGWIKRWCPGFSKRTTLKEASKWKRISDHAVAVPNERNQLLTDDTDILFGFNFGMSFENSEINDTQEYENVFL